MADAADSAISPSPAPAPATSAPPQAVVAAAATASPASGRSMPVREDCWSEDATSTLIEAWGRRYVELNRGNLRQKDWQDVADAVNALHGLTKKTYRTDVQCKNRIDTIKKKYKVEKARVSASNGASTSPWAFFDRLDALVGPNLLKKPSPPLLSPSPPVAVPLQAVLPYRKPVAVAVPQKRSAPPPVPAVGDESFFRRNYSAMAAAAAAAEAADDYDDDDLDNDDLEAEEEERESESEERESEEEDPEGMRRLARAIASFGEKYERVEAEKLRQMRELETQRIQFFNELEIQRMRMIMDTQVQLERIKRNKRSSSNDIYG